MLKPFLLISPVLLLAFAATPTLGHMPQKAASSAANAAKAAADSQAKVKKLYSMECAMCHGDNGDGKSDLATSMQLTMPDFTDAKVLAAKTDDELFKIIRNGAKAGDKLLMPPEDPARAKDDDVKGLILYIRGMSSGQLAAPAN